MDRYERYDLDMEILQEEFEEAEANSDWDLLEDIQAKMDQLTAATTDYYDARIQHRR